MKFEKCILTFNLLIAAFFLFSCNSDNKTKSQSLIFPNIHERRLITTEEDTLDLHEFEFYHLLKFIKHDIGLGEYLEFEIQDSVQNYLVPIANNNLKKDSLIQILSPFEKISFASYVNEFKKIEDNTYRITLHAGNHKKIKRTISIGVTYRVLFSYNVDTETIRDNIATEYYSGYEIIDIVNLNQPFYRQTEN